MEVTMILTLDVGNTNIMIAVMKDGHADLTFSFSTVKPHLRRICRTAEACNPPAWNRALFRRRGSYSSVVPQLTPVIREAVRIATGKWPLVLGPGVKTGLNIRTDNPSELGADFVAAAVAAASSYKLPCVTIDMGTATTLGALDKNGNYIGSIICPGIVVSQEILAAKTSQLPHVSPEAPREVIGTNTEDCIKSGIMHGAAAQLDGLIDKIEDELGKRYPSLQPGFYEYSIFLPPQGHSDRSGAGNAGPLAYIQKQAVIRTELMDRRHNMDNFSGI